MTARERLPNRRQCESFEFRHAGLDFTLAAGFYADGRIAEIFLSSHKPGSPIEAVARDAAVTVSITLQFGVPLNDPLRTHQRPRRWPGNAARRGARRACGGAMTATAQENKRGGRASRDKA
jgi:hypothetical protein